jgi:hypothetical protein
MRFKVRKNLLLTSLPMLVLALTIFFHPRALIFCFLLLLWFDLGYYFGIIPRAGD